MTFHEVYGELPQSTLNLFKSANVTSSDWDAMLLRWGYKWGDPDIPWSAVEQHVTVHMVNGLYRYPMYG